MKILFLNIYRLYNHSFVLKAFREAGHEVKDVFFPTPGNFSHDAALEENIKKLIEKEGFDFVFTINFWSVIACAVHDATPRLPYISWSYDSPLNCDDPAAMSFDNNVIFLFDRGETEAFRKLGIKTVRHLPLAVEKKPFQKTEKKYDFSLLGSLYETAWNGLMAGASDRLRGYMEAVLFSQQKVYGEFLSDMILKDDLFPGISKKQLSFLTAQEATRRDRLSLVSLLSKRGSFCLVTGSETKDLKGLFKDTVILPFMDYEKEMPLLFRSTKINLNPPLRAIRTGINLRILDVMSEGAFLLSGFLPEIPEHFVLGEELECYSSLEEALEKAVFYMKNDSVREDIAMKGREKCQSAFCFSDRIEKIISAAKELSS